jgi:hypothetical protein
VISCALDEPLWLVTGGRARYARLVHSGALRRKVPSAFVLCTHIKSALWAMVSDQLCVLMGCLRALLRRSLKQCFRELTADDEPKSGGSRVSFGRDRPARLSSGGRNQRVLGIAAMQTTSIPAVDSNAYCGHAP